MERERTRSYGFTENISIFYVKTKKDDVKNKFSEGKFKIIPSINNISNTHNLYVAVLKPQSVKNVTISLKHCTHFLVQWWQVNAQNVR